MSYVISVEPAARTKNGWQYSVSVDGHSYFVSLDKDFFQNLVYGSMKPEELVKKSFEFLLEREPPTSILKQFDLSDIAKYFPEYEETARSGF